MLSHSLTGNRGRYATVFDEDGRVVIAIHDIDQSQSFEFVCTTTGQQSAPVRVEMPPALPTERGSWVIESDGSTVFNTPTQFVGPLYTSLIYVDFSEVQDSNNLTNAKINEIVAALQVAGILRETDVAVIPSHAELATSTDMNIFTPSPASAGTETDTEFDNGILAEARCICVDPTVVIA